MIIRKKLFFFEESYFADGKESNDIEIVEKIANIVGKDNVFVKIHPRNLINRFRELGYKTNTNTSIPWEVIAMNLDLSNKVLITIASVAAIVPTTMLGKKYCGILLFNCFKDNESFVNRNIVSLYESICEKHSNLHVVDNEEEMLEILKFD